MGVGKELKRLREEVPISAEKISTRIGVKADRWRKWEELDQKPRTEDTILIEKFFKMTIPELIKQKSIKKFLIVPHGTNSNLPDLESQEGFSSESAFKTIITYLKDLQNGQIEIINQGQIVRREVSGVADYLMLKDAEWDPGKLKVLKETYYSIVRGEVPEAPIKNKLRVDGKSSKVN